MSAVLRHLLINGPVIGHGDTFGQREGDHILRCFLGDSRAQRPYSPGAPLPALLLEFAKSAGQPANRDQRIAPPAPPVANAAPADQPYDRHSANPLRTGPPVFGRRSPSGFGKRGL
jgi:hypothetical protein